MNATIEAGAMGYVAKQSDGRELKNAIDSVLRGTLYVDSLLAKKLCLTKRTVENNISRIYIKTGLSTREELVRYGTQTH